MRRYLRASKRYGALAAFLVQIAAAALLLSATPHAAAASPYVSEGRQVAGNVERFSQVLALSQVPPTVTATPTSRPLPPPPTSQPTPTPRPYVAPASAPTRLPQAVPPTRAPLATVAPPQPTPVPPSQGCDRIIQVVNQIRAQDGLPALVYHPQLEADAQAYADFLAANGAISHTADGRTLDVRAEAAGYTTWTALGENLAGGYATTDDAVNAWMASPGHRANILNPLFKETGVGCAWNQSTSYGSFYVQEFGAR